MQRLDSSMNQNGRNSSKGRYWS